MAAATALCLMWPVSCASQTDTSSEGTQPQIQILILQTDDTGNANVAMTYPGTESMETAQKDITEIGNRTGWQISNPIMTDNPPSTAERPPMSSVEFTVPNALPPAASPQAGGFPIEPLVVALKRFRQMELVFATHPDFKFRGLRDYEDDYVRIDFRAAGQTYTYRVEVKQSNFDSLDLPVIVETEAPSTAETRERSVWPLVISVAAGAAVVLMAHLFRKRKHV